MFDRYEFQGEAQRHYHREAQRHSHQHTTTQHLAPTGEHLRLLSEYREEARKDVVRGHLLSLPGAHNVLISNGYNPVRGEYWVKAEFNRDGGELVAVERFFEPQNFGLDRADKELREIMESIAQEVARRWLAPQSYKSLAGLISAPRRAP